MLQIVIATIFFGILAAASIVLTGNRALISGIGVESLMRMLWDWRFVLSMALAVASRFTFIYLNITLLKVPALARNSTTITSFITAFGYIFIILANYVFLQERLTAQQLVGASMIMSGIFLMVK